jgi:hypothetical protein
MNTITKQQAKEIHYIVRLLTLDTQDINDVISNIDSIKLFASSLLNKCETIEKEMYSLAE